MAVWICRIASTSLRKVESSAVPVPASRTWLAFWAAGLGAASARRGPGAADLDVLVAHHEDEHGDQREHAENREADEGAFLRARFATDDRHARDARGEDAGHDGREEDAVDGLEHDWIGEFDVRGPARQASRRLADRFSLVFRFGLAFLLGLFERGLDDGGRLGKREIAVFGYVP